MKPGLRMFADSHDVALDNHDDTVAVLRRAGAVEVIACIEANDGRRPKLDTVLRLRDACARVDVSLVPFTFPGLLGDLARSRAWLVEVCDALGVSGMLDAEPAKIGHGVMHWSPGMLEPWLALDPHMTITTTRAEAPHLGEHDRVVYAQLEAQNSIATLEKALVIFERYTKPENIILTTGVFSEPDDPRTVDEVRHDLDACAAQAKRSGAHAAWSVHTTSPEKANTLRVWALETF